MAERHETPQVSSSERRAMTASARLSGVPVQPSILDSLPVAVWIGDERGRLIHGNAAAKRMSLSEVLAVAPGSAHGLTALIQARVLQALQVGRPMEPVEIGLRRPDGTRTRALLSAAPVFSEDRVVGTVGIGLEVRGRLTGRWRRPEDDPDRFLLTLSDALRPLSDPRRIKADACRRLGAFLDADRVAYAEVLDHEAVVEGQWVGDVAPLPERSPEATFGEAFLGSRRQRLPMVIEDAESERYLTRAERAAYRSLQVRGALGTMLVKGGQWVGALVVHSRSARTWAETDPGLVTETAERIWAAVERTRADQLIHDLLNRERAARTEAEQALRVRDEFLAMVSHELRTPLAAILLWSRLARDGTIKGREHEAIETIERNALEQQLLVEDLLEASRMFSGSVTLDRKPLALAPLVRLAVEDATPAADERQIALDAEALDRDVVASIDPHRFAQIVHNLLDNSIRYSKGGGRVHIAVRREGDEAVVEVRDTGGGISAELLPHIFDRFRRGADSGSGGLGLGLAVAHDLVALHGGTISAESGGPGMGATFTVRLPAVEPPPAARIRRRASGQPASPGTRLR